MYYILLMIDMVSNDGYYVTDKSITLLFISFMFIEMKFTHCHSCVMFIINHTSIYLVYVHYNTFYSLSFLYDVYNKVREHM